MKNNLILLIEDNPDHEYLALQVLEDAQIDIKSVKVLRDGQESLDYIYGQGKYLGQKIQLPEVILLDLKLPKVNGLEILKEIRSNEKTKLIPVVILTSSRTQNDQKACFGEGANCYLTKPITLEKFNQAILQFLQYMSHIDQTES